MKRRLVYSVAGAAVSVSMLGAAACGSAPSTRYVALGDSIAAGIGASDEKGTGYVGLVDRHNRSVNERALEVVNLGKGGETSLTFLEQQWPEAAKAMDSKANVRLVTLTIGANDFLPLLSSGPCATEPQGAACMAAIGGAMTAFNNNFGTIMSNVTETLAASKGSPRIVVTTYYNPYSGGRAANSPTLARNEASVDLVLFGADGKVDCNALAAPSNAGLNDIITCTARSQGATVVDAYPLFDQKALSLTHIAAGDRHPTDEGHRLIAEKVIAAIS